MIGGRLSHSTMLPAVDMSKPYMGRPFLALEAIEEEAPCIPVDVDTVVADPVKDPYDIGDNITFSPNSVTGTTPYTYEWYINNVLAGTDPTLEYTVSDSDIQNKDENGLGVIFVYVKVFNECGEDETDTNASINAQGTPP